MSQTSFVIEVLTAKGWEKVSPSGREQVAYTYETRDEAEAMMRIIYPDLVRFGDEKVRVVPAGPEPKGGTR